MPAGCAVPAAAEARRPATDDWYDLREVVNAILCIATTGCQWAQLPKDFPPPSTVQRYFYDWRARAEAWVNIAHIRLTTRRLARHGFSA